MRFDANRRERDRFHAKRHKYNKRYYEREIREEKR